jgi:hypothetical protein
VKYRARPRHTAAAAATRSQFVSPTMSRPIPPKSVTRRTTMSTAGRTWYLSMSPLNHRFRTMIGATRSTAPKSLLMPSVEVAWPPRSSAFSAAVAFINASEAA